MFNKRPLFSFVVLLLAIGLPTLCPAQHFIGKKKTQVEKQLHHDASKNTNSRYSVSDTGLLFSKKLETNGEIDIALRFNKDGECIVEKIMAASETDYRHYLKLVLTDDKYEWKKINENQYLSKFDQYMMLETPPNNDDNSFTILRTIWTKEMYKLLTGN